MVQDKREGSKKLSWAKYRGTDMGQVERKEPQKGLEGGAKEGNKM